MALRAIVAAAALAGLVAGCARDRPSPVTRDAAPASSTEASAPPASAAGPASASASARVPPPDGGGPWAWTCDDDALPRSGRSIGHTSVVFKLELANGKKAAYKPHARKVRGRYRGEIAAYRLALALGIDNVPPACARAFDVGVIRGALASNADAARLFDEEAIVEDGRVHGVIIPWIDGLQFWPLEKDPLRSEARRWLIAKGAIPPGKLELARQASSLVAFDYLTGNWDRYSGANVGLDSTGAHVLYIDNDAAFMEGPPKEALAKNGAVVEATDRFSRSLVERARGLDEAALTRAFGTEREGQPLLPRGVVEAVARRARELVALVDDKAKRLGHAEVLYFP